MNTPVGVLLSGSGTNLQALLDAAAEGTSFRIAVVISNRRDAHGLERARQAGVPAVWIPHRGKEREAHEAELVAALREHGAEWVALAGYMRLLKTTLLAAFPQRVLNIHPALLPSFPGTHGQRQAFEYGVRIAGCTLHFVDHGTDTGPIIAQGAVPVLPDDDEDALKARILGLEHELYPRVLRWAVEGRLRIDGRRVHVDLPEGEEAFVWAR